MQCVLFTLAFGHPKSRCKIACTAMCSCRLGALQKPGRAKRRPKLRGQRGFQEAFHWLGKSRARPAASMPQMRETRGGTLSRVPSIYRRCLRTKGGVQQPQAIVITDWQWEAPRKICQSSRAHFPIAIGCRGLQPCQCRILLSRKERQAEEECNANFSSSGQMPGTVRAARSHSNRASIGCVTLCEQRAGIRGRDAALRRDIVSSRVSWYRDNVR